MPKYTFKILCADNPSSHKIVQDLMSDFKIQKAKESSGYHHYGIIELNNSDDAVKRVIALKDNAGTNLINVIISK